MGHSCLFLDDEAELRSFSEAMDGDIGHMRRLVVDSRIDPDADERWGTVLLESWGDRFIDFAIAPYDAHWIGAGTVRTDPEGVRPIVVLGERGDPVTAAQPQDASWTERLVAVAGWVPRQTSTVDWDEVHRRLGTPLPSDYRNLVDAFGRGGFDGYLVVATPEPTMTGTSLIDEAWQWADYDERNDILAYGYPRRMFPRPGGLLEWGRAVDSQCVFFWATEGEDPDQWPTYVTDDADQWDLIDMPMSEVVFRQTTDPDFYYSTADDHTRHWFADRSRGSTDFAAVFGEPVVWPDRPLRSAS